MTAVGWRALVGIGIIIIDSMEFRCEYPIHHSSLTVIIINLIFSVDDLLQNAIARTIVDDGRTYANGVTNKLARITCFMGSCMLCTLHSPSAIQQINQMECNSDRVECVRLPWQRTAWSIRSLRMHASCVTLNRCSDTSNGHSTSALILEFVARPQFAHSFCSSSLPSI